MNSDDKGDFGSGDEDEGIVVFGNMGKSNQPSTGKSASAYTVLDNFGIDLTKVRRGWTS